MTASITDTAFIEEYYLLENLCVAPRLDNCLVGGWVNISPCKNDQLIHQSLEPCIPRPFKRMFVIIGRSCPGCMLYDQSSNALLWFQSVIKMGFSA